jgi:hypothetical protein
MRLYNIDHLFRVRKNVNKYAESLQQVEEEAQRQPVERLERLKCVTPLPISVGFRNLRG